MLKILLANGFWLRDDVLNWMIKVFAEICFLNARMFTCSCFIKRRASLNLGYECNMTSKLSFEL